MKHYISVLFFIGALCASAQSLPQLQLNTSEFKPSTFTATPYIPQQSDPTLLQKSLQQRENRANYATESLVKLKERCFEISEKMPTSEKEWFRQYSDAICNEVQSSINIGDYQIASDKAYRFMTKLNTDKQVLYRLDSYSQYCDALRSGNILFQNGKVDPNAYDYWLYKNQYKFQPKYDNAGVLTGYTPCYVSPLYESIDWNNAYNFITQNGKTKSKIAEMWKIYMMDKIGSLCQEYEVSKFYHDYFSSILNSQDIPEADREAISKNIAYLKNLVFDKNNETSFDIFVANLQAQLLK